jgi:hypothetical protein
MKSEIDPMPELWNSDHSAGLTPEWKPIRKINSALPWIERANDKTEVKSVYSHTVIYSEIKCCVAENASRVIPLNGEVHLNLGTAIRIQTNRIHFIMIKIISIGNRYISKY